MKNNKEVLIEIKKGEDSCNCKNEEDRNNNKPSGSIIYFSNKSRIDCDEDNTPLYPLTNLAHELGHAYINMKGLYDCNSNKYWKLPNGELMFVYNEKSESFAIDIENSIRVPMKDMVYRKTYSGYKLPIKLPSAWNSK